MENTFLRQEYKYRIQKEDAEGFLKKISPYAKPDIYPEYDLHNIYFDTDDFVIAAYCQERHVYKEKLRLRSYANPNDTCPVYLEIKKKYLSLSSKRRISLTRQEAQNYLFLHQQLPFYSQIYREIDTFFQRRQYKPKIFISYHRLAFSGRKEPDLRITMDDALCYRNHDIDLSLHGDEGSMLNKDERMLEIKADQAMPCWLVDILTQMHFQRTSFSKYCTAYRMVKK